MLLRSQICTAIIAISLFNLSSIQTSANPVEGAESWLETEKPQNWNKVGANIPQAPKNDGYGNLQRCEEQSRNPSTPEDEALVKAGWTLFGSIQVYGQTSVRSAMSDADGMCRPMGYQAFVFVNGQFAGTLSPIPMSSRTDGSAIRTYLSQKNRLTTVFNRYNEADALCCPSRTSNVSYVIEYQRGIPVVIPQQVYTNSDKATQYPQPLLFVGFPSSTQPTIPFDVLRWALLPESLHLHSNFPLKID